MLLSLQPSKHVISPISKETGCPSSYFTGKREPQRKFLELVANRRTTEVDFSTSPPPISGSSLSFLLPPPSSSSSSSYSYSVSQSICFFSDLAHPLYVFFCISMTFSSTSLHLYFYMVRSHPSKTHKSNIWCFNQFSSSPNLLPPL